MPFVDNPYSVLGISRDAPDAVVEAAYRALAKEKHPDNGGDPDEFKFSQRRRRSQNDG